MIRVKAIAVHLPDSMCVDNTRCGRDKKKYRVTNDRALVTCTGCLKYSEDEQIPFFFASDAKPDR